MKKVLFTALSLAVAMSLNAKVFATVDGKDITDVDLAPMLAGMPGVNFEALPAEIQNQVIDRAIDLRVLINEAKKSGIEKDELYKKQLEIVKDDIALRAWQAKELNNTKVSDKEIEDFYNKNKDKFIEPAAIAASHILVEKEDDAKKIIADLSKLKGDELKKKFAEIAKEKSIDPSGKQNGGDLGYFVKEQMVPEFGEAANKLKKGELTKTPVKTQFGYHVILKNDAKDKKQLGLAEVKDYVKSIVRQEKFQADFEKKVKDLKSKAKIEYKNKK
ncbi:peptidylprolyl isomerase [Campylobacter ureolyticus]|uniref:Peptidyl-prolyl cis-trans isomerase Cbf2 n=1 Tax=Campylobacter ureolyticus TaxID=827 RepID=A0A6N2R6Y7_9BACT